jgi:hypothetical protein
MRRKKHIPYFVRNCDHCGAELKTNEPNSDTYVVTAERKIFCRIHHVGQEPIKDCLENYIRSKNVRSEQIQKKSEEQRRLQSNSQEQLEKRQKEKKEIRLENLAKIEAYLKELKSR